MFLDYSASHQIHTDACNEGAGVLFGYDWEYVNWEVDWPEVANLHINHKETLAFIIAAKRWAPFWSNSIVTVFTDNTCTKGVLNKGSCKNSLIMDNLRDLFWLSACFNFAIKAVHIPGVENITPDTISRIHEPGKLSLLSHLFLDKGIIIFPNNLRFHMSRKSISLLIFQILMWLGWRVN